MSIDYLVFFDKQAIGVVSPHTDERCLARSIHRPRCYPFRNRQQATRWVKGMHALATGHCKGILKVALPNAAALYTAYRSLAEHAYLFVPTDQQLEPGDRVLLELAQTNKRYYVVVRIVWCNPEPSSELPAGVGLESIFSEQLRKQVEIQ